MNPMKKLTPHEKYMLQQKQLEIELGRLRKEWTVLEKIRGRPSYIKFAKVVELYKKEYANIRCDLARAKDPGRKKEDSKIFDILFIEISTYDQLKETVSQQTKHMLQIEDEIKKVKKSVGFLSKQQVTDRQHQDRVWAIMKTVEALENKLETQMIKFGTICTKNKSLREEIDHLLWERRIFLQQWDKFVNKLADGKQIMLDLIEQATIAYNQREEWCNKLQALRIKAHQDLLVNMQEMQDYIRKHDQNAKLEEFFLVKGQKRQMRDLKEKVKQRRVQRQLELTEKLEHYKNMMTDIQDFTREKGIQQIAKKFAVQDEYNLSNFIYLINLLREMENISDNLGMFHLDIDEKNSLCYTRKHQQQMTIGRLEEKLEQSTQESATATEQLNGTEEYLDNLLEGVSTLFRICKCNQDPLLKFLGDNNSVKFYNVNFYIDLLESKIQQLLVTVHYQDKTLIDKRRLIPEKSVIKIEETVPHVYTIEKIVRVTPCSLCVEHEMVADVIDVLQVPVTRKMAQSRLKYRLSTPDGGLGRLHNISNCQLPQSRGIMQKRYQ